MKAFWIFVTILALFVTLWMFYGQNAFVSSPPLVPTDEAPTLPQETAPTDEVVTVNPSQKTDKKAFKTPRSQLPPPEVEAPLVWPKGQVEAEIKMGKYAVGYGDIILGVIEPEKETQTDDEPKTASRAMVKIPTGPNSVRLWTQPIAVGFVDGVNKEMIWQVLSYLETVANLKFKLFENEKQYILFSPTEELCASQLGMQAGGQYIFLAQNCGFAETLHEMMHALGFVHEHSRPDRDQFVVIEWNHIDPQYWLQFMEVPEDWVSHYRGESFAFDPTSVMMYSQYAFSKQNGLLSIRVRDNFRIEPSRQGLSGQDRLRLQQLYP